jgi:hypothetical protein
VCGPQHFAPQEEFRMLTNEAELAQRASQHDQEAFAQLYHAYVEKIYTYI